MSTSGQINDGRKEIYGDRPYGMHKYNAYQSYSVLYKMTISLHSHLTELGMSDLWSDDLNYFLADVCLNTTIRTCVIREVMQVQLVGNRISSKQLCTGKKNECRDKSD